MSTDEEMLYYENLICQRNQVRRNAFDDYIDSVYNQDVYNDNDLWAVIIYMTKSERSMSSDHIADLKSQLDDKASKLAELRRLTKTKPGEEEVEMIESNVVGLTDE
jgi:hypothetical protein